VAQLDLNSRMHVTIVTNKEHCKSFGNFGLKFYIITVFRKD
jgi:hypothetical protein